MSGQGNKSVENLSGDDRKEDQNENENNTPKTVVLL